MEDRNNKEVSIEQLTGMGWGLTIMGIGVLLKEGTISEGEKKREESPTKSYTEQPQRNPYEGVISEYVGVTSIALAGAIFIGAAAQHYRRRK